MGWAPEVRNLVIAGVVAALTTAGAAAVLMQPEDTTRKITGTNDAAPGLAWSVDPTQVYGADDAQFRHPAGGTEYDAGGGGFIAAGATLVSVIAVPDGQMYLREPRMYGFDAETGAVRWQAPAADLGGCAPSAVDDHIVCYTSGSVEESELVGYDVDSGAVTRTPVDWMVFALEAVDDRIYVGEGDVESDDVRVHSGTLADPDAHWTRSFAMGTAWENAFGSDILDVEHGQGVFTLGVDVAGFELETGQETWTLELSGCSSPTVTFDAIVLISHSDCSGNGISGVDVVDRTGRTLVADMPGPHSLLRDEPADSSIPVLIGDTAYDRSDGSVLWTSSDLVYHAQDDPVARGAAIAVLGDIALVFEPFDRVLSGLDLRTGQRLWQTDSEQPAAVRSGEGGIALLTDYDGLRAIDLSSGEGLWDTPFDAIVDEPHALLDNGELVVLGEGRYAFVSGRMMIGLRPLP